MQYTDALTSCSLHQGLVRKVAFDWNGERIARTTRQDFIWRNAKANTKVGPEYVIIDGKHVPVSELENVTEF